MAYIIDQTRLTNALALAEKDGPLPNLDSLWKKTAEIYNQNIPVGVLDPITFSVALLRLTKWQKEGTVTIKTQAGRKGRVADSTNTVKVKSIIENKPVVQDEPISSVEETALSLKLLIQQVPDSLKGLAERTQKSRAAAVKLKCLDCCGWQRKEVANCTARACALWSWRPYQGKEEETNIIETTPVEENSPSVLTV